MPSATKPGRSGWHVSSRCRPTAGVFYELSRLLAQVYLDDVGGSKVARPAALAQLGRHASLRFCGACGAGLELDVPANDPELHRGQALQARAVELAHLHRLV